VRTAIAVLFVALISWAGLIGTPEEHINLVVSERAKAVRSTTTNLTKAPTKVALATQIQVQPPEKPVLDQHQQWMQDAGIAQSDWPAVDYIVSHESGWCAMKWEGEIGYCPTEFTEFYSVDNAYKGYGVCQSSPASKMATIADDWQSNPVTQLKWCSTHADGYGGWWPAYNHWVVSHNW